MSFNSASVLRKYVLHCDSAMQGTRLLLVIRESPTGNVLGKIGVSMLWLQAQIISIPTKRQIRHLTRHDGVDLFLSPAGVGSRPAGKLSLGDT